MKTNQRTDSFRPCWAGDLWSTRFPESKVGDNWWFATMQQSMIHLRWKPLLFQVVFQPTAFNLVLTFSRSFFLLTRRCYEDITKTGVWPCKFNGGKTNAIRHWFSIKRFHRMLQRLICDPPSYSSTQQIQISIEKAGFRSFIFCQ